MTSSVMDLVMCQRMPVVDDVSILSAVRFEVMGGLTPKTPKRLMIGASSEHGV